MTGPAKMCVPIFLRPPLRLSQSLSSPSPLSLGSQQSCSSPLIPSVASSAPLQWVQVFAEVRALGLDTLLQLGSPGTLASPK